MNISNKHVRVLIAVLILIGFLPTAFGQQGSPSNIPAASTSAQQMKKAASVLMESLTQVKEMKQLALKEIGVTNAPSGDMFS